MLKTITKAGLCAGVIFLTPLGAAAQTAPDIDFSGLLANCQSDPLGCSAALNAALAEIKLAQATLPPSVVDGLLGSLATVAVAAAQTEPSLGAALGDVIADISETVSEESGVGEQLAEIAEQVSSGGADEVDLTEIGGSPA